MDWRSANSAAARAIHQSLQILFTGFAFVKIKNLGSWSIYLVKIFLIIKTIASFL